MSDVSQSIEIDRSTIKSAAGENISIPFFKEFHQIKDRRNKPLVNVYMSYANHNHSVCGTVYLMPGYGGSPVEPCMKLAMENALKQDFDVVVIEGVAISATSGGKKNLTEMNLARQKKALVEGLKFCEANERLYHNYKIAWAHSMSCRALVDLIFYSEEMRSYFDECVLNNPYFVPPSKVQKSKEKSLEKDPSGKSWRDITYRLSQPVRFIEKGAFTVPTCLHNLEVPIPEKWRAIVTSDTLEIAWDILGNALKFAEKVSPFINKTPVKFVLGTGDNMAEYSQNYRLFEALNVNDKKLFSIDGANHSFENMPELYDKLVGDIFNQIKEQRQQGIMR